MGEKSTDEWCENESERESNIEYIESCNKLYEKMKQSAIEYGELRIRSRNLSDQEFIRTNQQRTEAHDRFISNLTEYVDIFIPFARPVEEDEIRNIMKNRKKIGDLACYFLFMEGIKVR